MAIAAVDPGAAAVDELIEKLKKKFNAQYTQATKDMNKKLKTFMRAYDEENKLKKQQVKNGTLSKDEYKAWLQTKAYQKEYLQQMVNQLSADAATVDMKAASAIREYMKEAYAINSNYGIYQVDSKSAVDISWTLYDRNTVERIIKERPNLLPDPKPDIPKDMRWHKTKINAAMTQGILQGESIPKIAKRLQEVTDMDRRAAIRNARTAMTAAQNAGRVNSYKYAQSLGIDLEQEWLATLDNRTRDSHREMDGERAAVDTEFSNGCRYPGDPAGPPEEVYNCRCTLVPALAELDQSKADRESKLGADEDYEEWKFGKEDTELKKTQYELKSAKKKFDQMEDKVYTGIWKTPTSLSDYQAKAASIPAKRKYYEDALKNWDVPGSPEYELHEQKLKELNEFERLGKRYMEQQQKISDLSKHLVELQGGQPSPFSPDAYEEYRKMLAKNFYSREEADKYFRPLLDAQWDTLTDEQKYAVWEYTHNSNPMNKPLSGYEDSWYRHDFRGLGNTNWSKEDSYWNRTVDGEFKNMGHSDGHVDYAKTIAELTKGIDKTVLSDDVWLVRGSDSGGFAGLLEGNLLSFDSAKQLIDSGRVSDIRNTLVGQAFQSHSFLSTGIAKDAGFSGDVMYKIYAPKGTRAVYAEPQSYYGSTISGSHFYRTGARYSYVGSEAEVILQRGTFYRITDIQKTGRTLEVTMEVVDQPSYFTTGFEFTHNNGATSFNYKGKH